MDDRGCLLHTNREVVDLKRRHAGLPEYHFVRDKSCRSGYKQVPLKAPR